MKKNKVSSKELNDFISENFRYRADFIRCFEVQTGQKMSNGYLSGLLSGKKGISGITSAAFWLYIQHHERRINAIKCMLLDCMSADQIDAEIKDISALMGQGLSDQKIYDKIAW